MKIVTLKGIVLKKFAVNEGCTFIHIYTTELGVIEVTVKGAQNMLSRNFGAIQLYEYSVFSLRYSKNKYYLESSEAINIFYNIGKNINALCLAQYISEVMIYTSYQNGQKEDIMRLLLNIFHYMSEGSRSLDLLKSIFEMRFLSEIGMMPYIVCCIECNNYLAEYMYFDILNAHIYCNGCIKNSNINEYTICVPADVIHAIRHIIFADFNRLFNFRLSDKNMKTLGQITEKYLLIHLERNFKTLDYYKKLSL